MSEPTETVLIEIVLKSGEERRKRIKTTNELIEKLEEAILNNGDIRSHVLWRRCSSHHKSFAEDFTMESLARGLREFGIENGPNVNLTEAMKEAQPLNFNDSHRGTSS